MPNGQTTELLYPEIFDYLTAIEKRRKLKKTLGEFQIDGDEYNLLAAIDAGISEELLVDAFGQETYESALAEKQKPTVVPEIPFNLQPGEWFGDIEKLTQFEQEVIPTLPQELRAQYGNIPMEQFAGQFNLLVQEQEIKEQDTIDLFKSVIPQIYEGVTEETEKTFTQNIIGQLKENPEFAGSFFEVIQQQGRTSENENLLKNIIPEITEQDIAGFFEKAISVEQYAKGEVEIPISPEIEAEKSLWDTFYGSLRKNIFQTRQAVNKLLSMAPLPPEAKQMFSQNYTKGKVEFDDWVKKHPDLEPPAEIIQFKEKAGQLPFTEQLGEYIKNPMAMAYTIAEGAPPTLAALGAFTAVTALTGNPILGGVASFVTFAPMQIEDVAQDLISAGAPEDKAYELALPVGVLISSLDVVGEIPILKALSPALKGFEKGLQRQLVDRTVATLVKRGLVTFTTAEFTEALTEVAQQVIQDYTVSFFDKNRNAFENVNQTAVQTLIQVAPFAVFGGAVSMSTMRNGKPAKLTDLYNEKVEAYRNAGYPTYEQKLQALNDMAKLPEGEVAIKKAHDNIVETGKIGLPEKPPVAPEPATPKEVPAIKPIAKPPITPEITLYRGVKKAEKGRLSGSFWTPNKAQAQGYAGKGGDLFTLDIKASELADPKKVIRKNYYTTEPENLWEVVLTPKVQQRAKLVVEALPKAPTAPQVPPTAPEPAVTPTEVPAKPVTGGKELPSEIKHNLGYPEIDRLSLPVVSVREGYGESTYKLLIESPRTSVVKATDIKGLGFGEGEQLFVDTSLAKFTKTTDPLAGNIYGGNVKIIDNRYVSEMDFTPLKEEGSTTHLWRGMSGEEWENTVSSGLVGSKGEYNIGDIQKGATYFSEDARQALSYSSGFAPWSLMPTWTKPAVVIRIKRPTNLELVTGMKPEVGVKGKIPLSDIEKVYEIRLVTERSGSMDVYKDRYAENYKIGSRSSPSQSYAIREVPKNEWATLIREASPLPTPEAGMPEAGYQPAMIEGVTEKEVRPKGKGKVTQISMDEQLQLEQARQADEAEGLKASLETDPVAQHRVKIGGKNVSLEFFISLREQNFPDYFTVKQAQALFPGHDFSKYTQKGVPEYNHVPRDEALDDLTKTFNMSADEIADRVMAIREEKRRIKTLESEVAIAEAELPTVAPSVKVQDIPISVLEATSLSSEEVDLTLQLFTDSLQSQELANQRAATLELRKRVLARRASNASARAQELIVEGKTSEEAVKQAESEYMTGKLPTVNSDFMVEFADEMRTVLFAKVYDYWTNVEPNWFELMSTQDALSNALRNGNIPRKIGTGSKAFPSGGSAYLRLQRVFGGEPEVLLALDQGKPFEDVVEGVFRVSGQAPVPIDQSTADYLRGLPSENLYEPTAFREPIPVTKYEAPIEDAFKEIPLWPVPVRDNVVRALKEIGMLPVDIGNFLRANKASFDFSFWRQQAPLIVSHPISFVQANIEAWKAIWSRKSAEASWHRITQDPLYQIYEFAAEAGGDFLRPLIVPKGTSQWRGTEEFGYLTGERALPKLTSKLPWVKLSARAFETGTNVHNWLIFKNYFKAMQKLNDMYASGQKKLKVGEVFSIQKEMIDFSRSLANFSARGSLGKFAATAPELSGLFFAPRAAIGRILSVKDLINANPRVRAEAWKNAATFVSTFGGMVLIGAMMGWWDVEKDPRSAEFMSIRIGNTRIDPWGGYRQFLVFFARAITQTGVSSVTGAEYKADPLDLIQNFIRGKASPLASFFLDWWKGKNFVGEEFDVKNKRQWVERVAPFAVWDIYEAYQDDPATALRVSIPAIVGAGVQTYTGDWKENANKLGLPKYTDNLYYGITEPVYDVKDFWADTASQFKGVDPETLTEAKGYPPYIKAMVEAARFRGELDILPNQKLVSLNADPSKGITFVQHYQMWQERQKIVASGDKEKLKEFDADERTRNAYLGNISKRDYALLIEYYSITDKKKQAEFLEKHPELETNPREDWLKSHPEDNAKLSIWGQAKLLTQAAYDKAQQLIKEFDIPDSAVAEYIPPKEIAKAYFERIDTVDKWGANSCEDKLIRAKNPDLNKWLGLGLIDTPIEALELKVKNRDLQAQYDALPTTALQDQFEADHPEWVDDNRRIDAYSKGPPSYPTPQKFVDMNVKYGQIIDKYGANSAEAKLLGANNPDFFGWLEREAVTDNIKALELQVKNRELDPESQEYIDNSRKIEAYRNNADDAVANAWVERGQIADKVPGFNAEEKVWLADYPEVHKWALDNKLLTDDGSKWNIPALRITAKYTREDAEYEAIDPDAKNLETGIRLRDEWLLKPENEDYRKDRRRRNAYQLNLSGDVVEKYVEFYELPETGYRRERYRMNNPDLDKVLTDRNTMGDSVMVPVDPTEIPAEEYDNLREKWVTELNQYEKEIPKKYEKIADSDERAKLIREDRAKLLANKEFADDRLRINAYGDFFPEEYVENYVEYYNIPDKGYANERYLKEHPDFYKVIKETLGWTEDIKFDKIPTERFENAFNNYYDVLPKGKAREDYRWNNRWFDEEGAKLGWWKALERGPKLSQADRMLMEWYNRLQELEKAGEAQLVK